MRTSLENMYSGDNMGSKKEAGNYLRWMEKASSEWLADGCFFAVVDYSTLCLGYIKLCDGFCTCCDRKGGGCGSSTFGECRSSGGG